MQPIRLKAQLATDLEGVRRLLLSLAPRLEARQPGLTAQLEQADFNLPLLLGGRSGERVKVSFAASAGITTVFVESMPPTKPQGRLGGAFWRWRTRWLMRWALKQAKRGIEKQIKGEATIETRPHP